MAIKRAVSEATAEPVAKRRSSRQAASRASTTAPSLNPDTKPAPKAKASTSKAAKPSTANKVTSVKHKKEKSEWSIPEAKVGEGSVPSPESNADDVPDRNPDAVKHEGTWYWLLKAEPETRIENGVDVRFSIDDLRAREKPEGWDGIRNYSARNNLRSMNVAKAFFYHSNCKEPGIVGIMEIVKEYSEDVTARNPKSPYYDPKHTKENNRWSLVHVRFLTKFAVPIHLPELRQLGESGKGLEDMQLLRQSRLSVSKVSEKEWKVINEVADKKAQEIGKEHENA